jgi:hypothetical protein
MSVVSLKDSWLLVISMTLEFIAGRRRMQSLCLVPDGVMDVLPSEARYMLWVAARYNQMHNHGRI